MVVSNPKPYTGPSVMHLPLLPAQATALARVPAMSACANCIPLGIPLAEFHSGACAGIRIALAQFALYAPGLPG
ncbi:hypothetical protein ACUN29_41955, partial (plasmid) [Streptomyces sp. WC2508]|uniref:hypothetical protein n=1 Tax=Streptomyces sp. WC2508 TaxID=3461405 RepID=UPI004044FE8E